MRPKFQETGYAIKNVLELEKFFFFFFLNFVGVVRVPDPTSHFLPTSFLYVNLVGMGPVHLSPVTWPQALRYWYSLTPLMHIVAQLRPIDLHNIFRPNTRE